MREWLEAFEIMAKNHDGDTPVLTEPEIIRVLAVGGHHFRTGAGWVYLDAWEQLSDEQRLGARLAMSPEEALEMWTDLGRVLAKLGLIDKPVKGKN